MLDLIAWGAAIGGIVVAFLLLGVSGWILISGRKIRGPNVERSASEASTTTLESLLPEAEAHRVSQEANARDISVRQMMSRIVRDYFERPDAPESEIMFYVEERHSDRSTSESNIAQPAGPENYDVEQSAIDELSLGDNG